MKKLIPVIFLFVLIFSGCTHYYYVPNVQNVPLFTEKNQTRLSGLVGYASQEIGSLGDQQTTCVDFQAAYSLTNHIGVMMNYMWAKESHQTDESTVNNYGRGSVIEGAAGYYEPFGLNGIVEIYGGFGVSNQHHQYTNTVYDEISQADITQVFGTSDLSFVKLFIQPSVGFKLNSSNVTILKPFDIAFSTRFYSINYGKITYTNAEIASIENFAALSDGNHYFIEPALTIRGGWETVKLQFQLGYAASLNNSGSDFYEKCHISLGLFFALGSKEKKLNQETK